MKTYLDGLRDAKAIALEMANRATGQSWEDYGQRRAARRIAAAIEIVINAAPLCELRTGELGLSGVTGQPDGSVGG